jgi:protein-disulfide isomerase-like protein with CxxC motif
VTAPIKPEHRELALETWRRSNDPAGADFGPELFAQALADLEATVESRVRLEQTQDGDTET